MVPDYVFLLCVFGWGCECTSINDKYVEDPGYFGQMCTNELVLSQDVTPSVIACAFQCSGTAGCTNIIYLDTNKTCFAIGTDNPFNAGSSPLPGASFFTTGDASVARPTACHDGWVAFDGNCYLFPGHRAIFQEARDFCEQQNGQLVEIQSDQENNFLKDELRKNNPYAGWIGATDATTEGSWTWLSNNESLTYSDWTSLDETVTDNADCAILWRDADYKWADSVCTSVVVRPICEKSGAAGVCIWDAVR